MRSVSGPSELVTVDGDVVHASGDLDARYPIYSLTKPVIAAALLHAGLLDDEARLLASHRAGLFDYGRLPEYHRAVAAHPSEPWDDASLLARARAAGPADGWQYSNTGYLLLRRRLDGVGGLARFLPALGLADATVAEELHDLDDAVPARSRHLGPGRREVRGRYHPRWVGHRSLVATARGLQRFWSALPPALADPAHLQPIGAAAPGFVRPSYGLGVMADPGGPHGLELGHGGGGPGYAHAVLAIPARSAIAIVLTADEDADAQSRARALLHEAVRRRG